MFNDKRIEIIRKNVQTSTLLSDHEKSDWLNLLELMNDKQLGELEEILAAEPQPQAQPSTPKPVSSNSFPSTSALELDHPTMPPLTHIANVPTDVTMTHSVPTVPTRPTPSPDISGSKAPLPPKPNYVKPSHVSFGDQKQPVQSAQSVQQTRPAAPASKSEAIYEIKTIEDLQNISVDTIRNFSLQSIFDAVRKSIEESGYFVVLQLIEASPLYKDYINAGKERLGGQTETKSGLIQAEFEFMTDLLRNMRFNRW